VVQWKNSKHRAMWVDVCYRDVCGGSRIRSGVHDARNWSKILNGERINQSHWSSDRIIQMRLVNTLSVQDLGPISSIVDTGPYTMGGNRIEVHLNIVMLLMVYLGANCDECSKIWSHSVLFTVTGTGYLSQRIW